MTSATSWRAGLRYALNTIVQYGKSGKFYQVYQVDETGTSNATNPLISTWYWREVSAPVPKPAPAPVSNATFFDDFSNGVDKTKWLLSSWDAPGANATHTGGFVENNVSVINGMLCLKLTQQKNSNGTFTSIGAELATIKKFGYGTYEFVVKASSDSSDPNVAGKSVSGSITGLFNYLPGSATEIDVEVEGTLARNGLSQFTSWTNENAVNEHTAFFAASGAGDFPHELFHKYKFVWAPGKIQFFRDDVLMATHTKIIPTQAASFLINHWGTNDPDWGGVSTPGVTRYMWVKSFSFTAA